MPEVPVMEYGAPKAPRTAIDAEYLRCRRSVMIAIMFGYGFMYTCRLGFNVAKKDLIDGGLFTTSELGRIGANFFYGYAFGRLVNGILADHANLKRFFTLGVLLTAGVNLVMGSAPHYWLWAVLWGLNGWFQGFGAPSCIVSIARWFGALERGRAYGVWSTAHSIGEGLTFVGTSLIVSWWGWQAGFIGPGIFCLFTAVGVYLLMKDRPETEGLPNISDWQRQGAGDDAPPSRTDDGAGRFQWQILKLPALWIICLASASMYVTRYAINSWGIMYLQTEQGYSTKYAGLILGLNTAAGLAGCVAFGYISDLLFRARRPPVTLFFGILEVLSLIVIFYIPPGHEIIFNIAWIVYGFTLSGLLAVLGGLFAVDIVPKYAAGAAIGMTGVFSYMAAGIQDRITATLLHRNETVINGVHHFDWNAAILFWIGSSVVSLLLASSLWRVKMRE